MSLIGVVDAKNMRYGFDVEGTVKCMTESRYVNKRNGCGAFVSDAKLSDGLVGVIDVSF